MGTITIERCLYSRERPRLCNMQRHNCRRSIQTTRFALKCGILYMPDCTMAKSVTMCILLCLGLDSCEYVEVDTRSLNRCSMWPTNAIYYILYRYSVYNVYRIPPPQPLFLCHCPASWKTVLDLTALLLCKIKCSMLELCCASMRKHSSTFVGACLGKCRTVKPEQWLLSLRIIPARPPCL